ncbi:MAG: 30S ribosomal protein S12 methylthiotransferase RimO [Deltaproteobacteria bacterium]|jgi:ribosomal protein S12 methylthiotransferase|nr:30S ribosomal protein S12 methylthiotransferase RimO [Deltaproteobacteria bacterium]MBT4089130.1 30S ribosomal protein S12 methylthiotransferase RimO [Deltaproteobacteria bacterium]MBT4263919.1 30S ribosomal protein S12 methylthiotransferase RimO [Deltaproteobacteria bacterium]MBT4639862.1 30S ribosomal protein S12 methylthiotransferase RimO [Deltaproteobacteria bacterium]MBT6503453.1 30S ribosomal protein S12 methylthiotransferase RimO [Deltaproteobacteria bacterium]
MKYRVYLETLGCAKNSVDSEIMMGQMLADGYEMTADVVDSDVMVINTCAFITKAVNESIDRILSLAQIKKKSGHKKLIVAGCLSERYRKQLLDEIPEIDVVMGTSDYTQITKCIAEIHGHEGRIGIFEKKPLYSVKNLRTEEVIAKNKNYAYLKISEGCSNMCSFCNIPKLRGPFKSRSLRSIEQEFLTILRNGIKEINLISQDSASYGLDLDSGADLLSLVQKLLKASASDFWLRIFYAYPNRYPKELFHLMAEDSRLTPYADIPFQHIDDSVLKGMNRKITALEIENLIETALTTKPDLALRSTFIVGFPNETERAFRQLLRFVEKGYFSHLGVFTYSEEDNIRSRKMGDPISEEEKVLRRDQLMQAQQKISLKKNQAMIGQKQKVLIEGAYEQTDLLLQGRNQYQGADVDGLVLINEGSGEPGDFHLVDIIEAHPYDLIGRIS